MLLRAGASVAALAAAAHAAAVYPIVLDALRKGAEVRFSARCGATRLQGGVARTWERFYDARFGPQDYVATGDARLELSPAGAYVFRLVTLRVFNNDTATVETFVADPSANYSVLSHDLSPPCALSLTPAAAAAEEGGPTTGVSVAVRPLAPLAGLDAALAALAAGTPVRYVVEYASCALDGASPSTGPRPGRAPSPLRAPRSSGTTSRRGRGGPRLCTTLWWGRPPPTAPPPSPRRTSRRGSTAPRRPRRRPRRGGSSPTAGRRRTCGGGRAPAARPWWPRRPPWATRGSPSTRRRSRAPPARAA